MAINNQRLSNLEIRVNENSKSIQQLQTQMHESFNSLKQSMDEKFNQMMERFKDLLSVRLQSLQTTNPYNFCSNNEEIEATAESKGNEDVHKEFDKKSIRGMSQRKVLISGYTQDEDCLYVETFEYLQKKLLISGFSQTEDCLCVETYKEANKKNLCELPKEDNKNMADESTDTIDKCFSSINVENNETSRRALSNTQGLDGLGARCEKYYEAAYKLFDELSKKDHMAYTTVVIKCAKTYTQHVYWNSKITSDMLKEELKHARKKLFIFDPGGATKCNRAEVTLFLLKENQNGFDVIISDDHVPDIDGFKFLEHIGLKMDLPVIMMSTNDSKNVMVEGVGLEQDGYIITLNPKLQDEHSSKGDLSMNGFNTSTENVFHGAAMGNGKQRLYLEDKLVVKGWGNGAVYQLMQDTTLGELMSNGGNKDSAIRKSQQLEKASGVFEAMKIYYWEPTPVRLLHYYKVQILHDPVGVLGEWDLGRWKNGILSAAAEAPGQGSEALTSTLALAEKRTSRTDILSFFRQYRGGRDIANKHYWASIGYTCVTGFILAVLWFFISFGIVFSVHQCCGWRIHINDKESCCSQRICLIMLIFLTCAATIGCILISVGHDEFHGEALHTLNYVVSQLDYTVQTLRNVFGFLSLAKTVNVAQVFLSLDVKDDIDKLNADINTAAETLWEKTNENSVTIRRVFDVVRLALTVVAAVMLLVSVLGLILSILGHQHAMAQSVDEQVVVSQVLVADINIGYEDIVNTQVLAFNGKPVKNLKSLAYMVESCDEEFLKFHLEYEQIVILQTKKMQRLQLLLFSPHIAYLQPCLLISRLVSEFWFSAQCSSRKLLVLVPALLMVFWVNPTLEGKGVFERQGM